jgi:hypothetical protein
MRGLARAAEGALGFDGQKGRVVRARYYRGVHHARFEAFVGFDASIRTHWDADNFVCRTSPGEHGSEKRRMASGTVLIPPVATPASGAPPAAVPMRTKVFAQSTCVTIDRGISLDSA